MDNGELGAHSQRFLLVSVRIALLLVPLLVFAGLAAEISRHEDIPFDRPVMMWLHSASTPWLTDVMTTVSHFGGHVVPVVAVATALILCWLRRWRDAVLVVVAENGAAQLNDALKSVFDRPRPDFWEHLSVENTYSFPSGHAMASMAIAAALLVVAWGTRYRWAALVAAVVYVVGVGASRVYLGVHFPSDVLAGWCLTVLWVGVVVVLLRLLPRWNAARLIHQRLGRRRGGSPDGRPGHASETALAHRMHTSDLPPTLVGTAAIAPAHRADPAARDPASEEEAAASDDINRTTEEHRRSADPPPGSGGAVVVDALSDPGRTDDAR